MTERRILLFDLDGVLLDSAKLIQVVLTEMRAGRGRPPIGMKDLHPLLNRGGLEIVREGLGDVAQDEVADLDEFRQRYARSGHTPSCLYPDVITTLTRLARAGWRMGVCTNKPEPLAVDALQATGISPYFETVAAGTSRMPLKPHPDLLIACLVSLGATADETVYVGDSHTDYLAADAAGMAFVRAAYGYPSTTRWGKVMPVIESMEQLPDALANLTLRQSPLVLAI